MPGYDRAAVIPGIVHLGIGAFHRAHQAVYTEAALEAGERGFGITGASLRSTDTRDALAPQDGLYTVAVRDGAEERLQVVGAIGHLLVAPENPAALLAALTAPPVKVVTLTVTEKGYCHDPATGALDTGNCDIVHDLRHPESPRSAIGFVTCAIARRRALGLPPFTVLCCDNLPANGRALQRLVLEFARLASGDLASYIADTVPFPCSMVDRIVPATTDEDRAQIAHRLGVEDAWPVVTEPFTQWVVEDRFAAGRPRWEDYGATLVSDVEPYEAMKLRLLNGTHSALAYLGYLSGRHTVAEAMAVPELARYASALMAQSAETLHMPPGADWQQYRAQLLARFANPALKHRTWQIAMDGSQKLPQRLLGTMRDLLTAGKPLALHALAVAAWMRYVAGLDEAGAPIDVRDPLAAELAAAAKQAGPDAARLAPALLQFRPVFGADLPLDARFCAAVTEALGLLYREGATRAAAITLGQT